MVTSIPKQLDPFAVQPQHTNVVGDEHATSSISRTMVFTVGKNVDIFLKKNVTGKK